MMTDDLGALVGLGHKRRKASTQRLRHGVAGLGAIEGDRRHAVGHLEQDDVVVFAHGTRRQVSG